MTVINFHLPEPLASFAQAQAASEGFRNVDEYLTALLRQAQQAKERADLEAKLLEGVAALRRGEKSVMTAAEWDQLRADLRARYGDAE
jgi:Arc/MetJ-type ribon-helix-helix transcriptional regulator